MHLAWTTAAPCSLSHKTPQKILPPLLFLWLYYYISWRLRVKMFVHTWRSTNSVLNVTYCVGQVYIFWFTPKPGNWVQRPYSESLGQLQCCSFLEEVTWEDHQQLPFHICRVKCTTQWQEKTLPASSVEQPVFLSPSWKIWHAVCSCCWS